MFNVIAMCKKTIFKHSIHDIEKFTYTFTDLRIEYFYFSQKCIIQNRWPIDLFVTRAPDIATIKTRCINFEIAFGEWLFLYFAHSTWGQRRRRKPQLTPGKLCVYLCVVRCTPLCYIHRWSLTTFTTAPVRYTINVSKMYFRRSPNIYYWRTKPHRLTQH